MFSQHDEEQFVLEHAGQVGKFLDIGSNDGVTFSNTHALALAGWAGVCVEPSPHLVGPLIKTYPDAEKITIIAAALGDKPGLIGFWSTDGMVSTTEKSMMEKWCRHSHYRRILMPQITWADVAALGPFQMINIDTEGTSLKLFDSMPAALRNAARVIVVEHNGDRADLHIPKGWKQVYDSSENAVLVNTSVVDVI
jgi:FkbM family methyltransferase